MRIIKGFLCNKYNKCMREDFFWIFGGVFVFLLSTIYCIMSPQKCTYFFYGEKTIKKLGFYKTKKPRKND